MNMPLSSACIEYARALSGYWPTARALSKNNLGATGLFLVMLSIPLRKRLFGYRPKLLRIAVAGTSVDFFVRDGVDISVLREMFVGRDYDIKDTAGYQPTHIADLGAHIGAAALLLHSRYPAATITAYEPDPGNFVLLKRNLSTFTNIECVNAAVAATAGTIRLYPHKGGSTRATVKPDVDSVGEINVPAVLFEEVVRKGADFVKFDVEGAEYDLFAAAPQAAREKVPLYVGEFHAALTGKTPAEFETLFPNFSCTWNGALVSIRRN